MLFWHFLYFSILYLLTFCFPLSVILRPARVADEFAEPSWFRPVAGMVVVRACYYAPYFVVRHAYGEFPALLFVLFVIAGVLEM